MKEPVITLQKSGVLSVNYPALKDMGMEQAKFGLIETDKKSKCIKVKFNHGLRGQDEMIMTKTRPGPGAGFRFSVKKNIAELGIKMNFSRVIPYDFDGDTLIVNLSDIS
jgi:hypothetical protein